ncbi:hypothetical protein FI667_g1498, partial [Globisporangium splendens]
MQKRSPPLSTKFTGRRVHITSAHFLSCQRTLVLVPVSRAEPFAKGSLDQKPGPTDLSIVSYGKQTTLQAKGSNGPFGVVETAVLLVWWLSKVPFELVMVVWRPSVESGHRFAALSRATTPHPHEKASDSSWSSGKLILKKLLSSSAAAATPSSPTLSRRLVWLFVLLSKSSMFSSKQFFAFCVLSVSVLSGVHGSSEAAQTFYYGGTNPAVSAGASAGANAGLNFVTSLKGYASPIVQAGAGAGADFGADADVLAGAKFGASASLGASADVGAKAGVGATAVAPALVSKPGSNETATTTGVSSPPESSKVTATVSTTDANGTKTITKTAEGDNASVSIQSGDATVAAAPVSSAPPSSASAAKQQTKYGRRNLRSN